MGKQAAFTVYTDKTVVFQYDDKIYGTYKATEDPTAIPENEDLAQRMRGVELCKDDEILFRGGIMVTEDTCWLFNEDGTSGNLGLSYGTGAETGRDENGNIIDLVEPSAWTISELMNEPEMTHKGESLAWFGAVLFCILNGLSILFADELFRRNLSFRVRNADHVQPSDWEIAGRYINWTVATFIAPAIFIMGL